MKKFTLVSLVAAAAFATTAAFSASNVFAADETTPASDAATSTNVKDGNKNLSTDGTITLTKGDGTSDKNYPYTDITLVKAANISFGSKAVSTSAATYKADGENASNIVNVVNPGVASGWTVTAAASDFTDNTDSNNVLTLKGAQLTLGLTTPKAADDKNQSKTPSVATAMITGEGAGQTVFNAKDANTGVGDWSTTVDPETTTLSVPAGNVAGTYHADINWTLTNTVQ